MPHRLVETKPDLSTAAKWRRKSVWGGEEAAADGGVAHRGEVAHHHVQSLDCFEGNPVQAPVQRQFERIE